MSESVRLDHEKPDCLSSLAHELKNPLTSIIGFFEMLREQKMTPDELEERYTAAFGKERKA